MSRLSRFLPILVFLQTALVLLANFHSFHTVGDVREHRGPGSRPPYETARETDPVWPASSAIGSGTEASAGGSSGTVYYGVNEKNRFSLNTYESVQNWPYGPGTETVLTGGLLLDNEEPTPLYLPTSIPTSQSLIRRTMSLTDTLESHRFWDTPPRSGVISSIGNQQNTLPGPDDQVRVLVLLRADPVAEYLRYMLDSPHLLTNAEAVAVQEYSDTLANHRRQLLDQIQQKGIPFNLNREFSYLLNGFGLSIKMQDWKRLEGLVQVEAVYPDYEMHATLKDSVPLIGAPSVWAMTDAGGKRVTGQGVIVAILDTGVDYTHPDLGGCLGPACRVIGGYDFIGEDNDPMDDMGHGTHVAGIVAASGVLTGVAPGSKLLGYKVLDANGSGPTSGIIAALERAANPDGDPTTVDGVAVSNLSLGGQGGPDDPLCQAVDNAVDLGMVVVASAGNDGPSYETLGSPGVARKALSVAASDKSDGLAQFSSRGPVTGFYDLIKPDITAPGVVINSTVPISGWLGSPTRYSLLSGTSMAAPHIAGSVALLRQLHPAWSPEMIKANLMNTAKGLGEGVVSQGVGRVDVFAAAKSSVIVSPGSLGLGIDDLTQAIWSVSTAFTLTNVSNSVANYSLSINPGLPQGITVTLSDSNIRLLPGESRSVLFDLFVDNSTVANLNTSPYTYEGKVII